MKLTPTELLEKIRLGEDSGMEVKAVRIAGVKLKEPLPEAIADEIAAFANKSGGLLILGVDDKTKDILGVPESDLDALETVIRNVCHDTLKPALEAVDIYRRTLPDLSGTDRAILQVEIGRSLWIHDSPGGTYTRTGSSKRLMSQAYKLRMLMQRSQARMIRFDEMAVDPATFSDLEPVLCDRFRTERSDPSKETFLRKLGMVSLDEDHEWKPTVAGILLGTTDPTRWIRSAMIQAVAYSGKDRVPSALGARYQEDAQDITGPLDAQITTALHFVRRNMNISATKHVGRMDSPEYDLAAVFEALVNAVVHRDYSVEGSKIRLHMFTDRLELYVPGTLVNTLELDSMAERQVSRNDTIASLLSRLPVHASLNFVGSSRTTYMDRRGEGVNIILKRTEQLTGLKARYELLDDDELKLTIPKTPTA